MQSENNSNKRKTKLLIIMLAVIVAVLLAGIVYQFVVIKGLQKQIETTAIIKNLSDNFLFFTQK